ncbi:Tail fiber assembly protein, partial [Bienertia sinuspersici]
TSGEEEGEKSTERLALTGVCDCVAEAVAVEQHPWGFLESSDIATVPLDQTWQKRFRCTSFFDSLSSTYRSEEDCDGKRAEPINRRQIILSSIGSMSGCLLNIASFSAAPPVAVAASSSSGFTDS